MTLLDRLGRNPLIPSDERVAAHKAENALKLYFHDHITRTQMISFFNIPVGMQPDFDQFKTKYDAFASNLQGQVDSEKWVKDVEACIIGLQIGDISKSLFNTILGLTLDET